MPASASLRRDGPRGISVVLLLAFVAALIFRVEALWRSEAADTLVGYAGAVAVVEGVVADDPDQREHALRAVVEVQTLNGQPARGRALVLLPREEALAYGERVVVRGQVELPESFETATGRVFDYPGYLRVRGISVLLEYAELRERGESGWTLRGSLFGVKHAFMSALERALPEPRASLIEGMLLGERGGISGELMQLFVLVGLVHIVVLSGSNISIVAEGVLRALSFLPKTAVVVVGGAVMVLFVVMTGGGAAGVRALVMALIALMARYLGRPAAALRALVVAAAGMLLWNPLYATDSGFVLSMLATFGLITLSPWVERGLGWLPTWEHFNIRSVVASTVGVNLFLIPALLYISGVFSAVALPVNALVLPFVWVIMLLGFVTGVLGLVHPLLAALPGLLLDTLLRALLGVAHIASAIPAAELTLPLWAAALVYVPLSVAALRIYARSPAN